MRSYLIANCVIGMELCGVPNNGRFWVAADFTLHFKALARVQCDLFLGYIYQRLV